MLKKSKSMCSCGCNCFILIEEAKELISRGQNDGSDPIAANMEAISNAICFISGQLPELTSKQMILAGLIMSELNNVRNNIAKFQKPLYYS